MLVVSSSSNLGSHAEAVDEDKSWETSQLEDKVGLIELTMKRGLFVVFVCLVETLKVGI